MLEIFPAHLKSIYTEGLYHFKNDRNQITGSEKIDGNISGDHNKILYTGSNKKNILILIQEGKNKGLNLEEYPFLKKILQSISLSEEDIALVKYKTAIPFPHIKKSITFSIALIFSIDGYLIEGEINKAMYNPQKIDETLYLLCDSLEDLELDVDKKKVLWKALKKIFN